MSNPVGEEISRHLNQWREGHLGHVAKPSRYHPWHGSQIEKAQIDPEYIRRTEDERLLPFLIALLGTEGSREAANFQDVPHTDQVF